MFMLSSGEQFYLRCSALHFTNQAIIHYRESNRAEQIYLFTLGAHFASFRCLSIYSWSGDKMLTASACSANGLIYYFGYRRLFPIGGMQQNLWYLHFVFTFRRSLVCDEVMFFELLDSNVATVAADEVRRYRAEIFHLRMRLHRINKFDVNSSIWLYFV